MKCVIRKGDENILAVTNRDIVAVEALYLILCYKNYTRVKAKDKEEAVNETDAWVPSMQYRWQRSSQCLAEFQRFDLDAVFEKKNPLHIAMLLSRFLSHLADELHSGCIYVTYSNRHCEGLCHLYTAY